MNASELDDLCTEVFAEAQVKSSVPVRAASQVFTGEEVRRIVEAAYNAGVEDGEGQDGGDDDDGDWIDDLDDEYDDAEDSERERREHADDGLRTKHRER